MASFTSGETKGIGPALSSDEDEAPRGDPMTRAELWMLAFLTLFAVLTVAVWLHGAA
jgi:hypothetical protein